MVIVNSIDDSKMQTSFVFMMKSVLLCILVLTGNDFIVAQIWYSASNRSGGPAQKSVVTENLIFSKLKNLSIASPFVENVVTTDKIGDWRRQNPNWSRVIAESAKNGLPILLNHSGKTRASDFIRNANKIALLDTSRKMDAETGFKVKSKFNSPSHNKRLLKRHRACKNGTKCVTRIRKRPNLESENIAKKSKFLEIFHVVNFDNSPCVASNGLDGMCFHQYDCEAVGGAVMGDCADGFGSCCIVQFTCGAQTRVASGWFTNPGFPAPSSDRLSCALALDKSNENVLQIRLDFLYFELQPGTDGLCDSDQFMVSGHNSNSLVPLLCGLNNGQHMYIEVGDVPGPIYLSMQTITDAGRLFAIKVSQLTASEDVAPAGCLQYFTDPDGVIESFNYQDKSTLAVYKYPSYNNNMNYAICVKRAKEQCSISYSNLDAEGQEAQFQILNYDTDGLPLIPPAQAGVEIFSCPDDFLALGGERLCGDKLNDGSVLQDFALNAPVTEVTAGPIVLYFKSDGSRVGRGFRLFYKQNPCTAEY